MKVYLSLFLILSTLFSYAQTRTHKNDSLQEVKINGFYATKNYDPAKVGYGFSIDTLKLVDEPAVRTNDIAKATRIFDQLNRPAILIELNKEGAEKFLTLTKENIQKPIAIVVNNKIIAAPVVASTILEGRIMINGNFSLAEVDAIINSLLAK